jgi:hypothetical protein
LAAARFAGIGNGGCHRRAQIIKASLGYFNARDRLPIDLPTTVWKFHVDGDGLVAGA